jgi:hypothetical protein
MGLCVQGLKRGSLGLTQKRRFLSVLPLMALNMPLPLDFTHQKGFEIPTKHKEAIRQLHWFGKVPVYALMVHYKLGDTTIRKILGYPNPERRRPNCTGPSLLFSNAKVDEIILYCAESWDNRILQ